MFSQFNCQRPFFGQLYIYFNSFNLKFFFLKILISLSNRNAWRVLERAENRRKNEKKEKQMEKKGEKRRKKRKKEKRRKTIREKERKLEKRREKEGIEGKWERTEKRKLNRET